MLINAQHPEELRIAVVDGTRLESYQVQAAERGLSRGNIYRGVIANIQPGLNAAFVDYGAERHGFLAIQDVVPEAYYHQPKGERPRIEHVLDQGKPIVVQVEKEPEGLKGAALTTNLSLAGRYLVLTPFESTIGVSRKVEDEEMRRKLREQVGKLEIPDKCGVIVRTNALDQTRTALQRDLQALLRVWKRVETEATRGRGTKLLYSDQDLILQGLRDHLDAGVEEVLIDDEGAFARAEEYMRLFMPRSKVRLGRYDDRVPLFSRFELDIQIDRIYERRVDLPAGGSIVIDSTEALTAIDVNSGKGSRSASQEETALATNLEAAKEVARQLRLRDLGGLIVVDFIDMRASKAERKLEKTLRDAMKEDKARFTVGKISPNGLLEINRQRIQQALHVRTHRACPTCAGTGRIASPEMVSLNLMRRIEAQAASGSLKRVKIALHPELADFFQNKRRAAIVELETEFGIEIEVIASPRLHRPDQEIEWVRRESADDRPALALKTRGQEPVIKATYVALSSEDEPEESEEAAVEAGDNGEGAEGERKSRRRRRGGRKRRERSDERGGKGDGKGDSKGDAPRAAEAADVVAPGRERRRGAAAAAPAAEVAVADPAAEVDPGGEAEEATSAEGAPSDAPREGEERGGRRRRRRGGRRRRRGNGTGAVEVGPDGLPLAGGASADDAGDEEYDDVAVVDEVGEASEGAPVPATPAVAAAAPLEEGADARPRRGWWLGDAAFARPQVPAPVATAMAAVETPAEETAPIVRELGSEFLPRSGAGAPAPEAPAEDASGAGTAEPSSTAAGSAEFGPQPEAEIAPALVEEAPAGDTAAWPLPPVFDASVLGELLPGTGATPASSAEPEPAPTPGPEVVEGVPEATPEIVAEIVAEAGPEPSEPDPGETVAAGGEEPRRDDEPGTP